MLQTEIAHDGSHDRSLEGALCLARGGNNEEQLVAVDDLAIFVDHHHAIPITIQGDADVVDDEDGEHVEIFIE